MKAVDDLKSLSDAQHSLTAAQRTATMPSYTNVTSTHAPHPSSQTFNPDAPKYVTRIENKLRIQDRQVFVAFDGDAVDAPKDKGGGAAYALCSKLNEWLRLFNQEADVVTNTSSHLVKSVDMPRMQQRSMEPEI